MSNRCDLCERIMPVLLGVSAIPRTRSDIFHSMLTSKLADSWCQISQMVPATIFCWFDLLSLSDLDVLFSYSEKRLSCHGGVLINWNVGNDSAW